MYGPLRAHSQEHPPGGRTPHDFGSIPILSFTAAAMALGAAEVALRCLDCDIAQGETGFGIAAQIVWRKPIIADPGLPALLTFRKILPVWLPAATVQSFSNRWTQSGTGMVRMWRPFYHEADDCPVPFALCQVRERKLGVRADEGHTPGAQPATRGHFSRAESHRAGIPSALHRRGAAP